MCTKTGIVPAMMIMAILFLFTGFFLVVLGFILMGHEEATIAYNSENVALGFLCFFLGGGLVPLGFVGTYGARSHNKFCLTVYVAAAIIIIFFLWGIGSGVSGLGDLDQKFTEPIQRDCNLLTQQGIADPSTCKEYYNNIKMIRMRQLWKHLHDQSKTSPSVKSFLVKLQKARLNEDAMPCCGFNRPTHCREWSECGMPSGHYAPTSYCTILDETYEKQSPSDKVPSGCPFEFPVGVCALSPLDEVSAGCGFTLVLWINSEMKGIGATIVTTSLVPTVGALFACCMCFKRKHADVLPTKYVQTMGA